MLLNDGKVYILLAMKFNWIVRDEELLQIEDLCINDHQEIWLYCPLEFDIVANSSEPCYVQNIMKPYSEVRK